MKSVKLGKKWLSKTQGTILSALFFNPFNPTATPGGRDYFSPL